MKKLIAWFTAVCMLTMICAYDPGIFAEEISEKEEIAGTEISQPAQEPTREPEETQQPAVEPTREPEETQQPAVEPTREPEETQQPAVEPTREPEETQQPADALTVSIHANAAYVVAGKSDIKMTAQIGGGTAPYTLNVTVSCSGRVFYTQNITLSEEGKYSIGYVPEYYGDYDVKVVVSDASGASASDSGVMPVSILVYETEEEWNESVGEIELTDDWRIDLVAVAETQIGYKESKKNFIIDENGRQGYTRYGDKYGGAYYEWCLMFVCFCMDYAQIPAADFPRSNRSYEWQKNLIAFGVYEDAEDDYEPIPGDLVFFNFEKEDSIHHVGIVYEVTEDGISTIEGNNRGAVRVCSYAKNDKTIIAYANMTALMERGGQFAKEIDISVKNWKAYTCGSDVNVRSNASVTGKILGSIAEIGSEVQLLGAVQNVDKVWYRVQHGEESGYILSDLLIVQDASEAVIELTAEPIAETVEEAAEEIADKTEDEMIPDERRLIGYTVGEHVNMREKADVKSQFVVQIEFRGTQVDVLDAVDMGEYIWYQVEYSGYLGYIRGDLIAVEEM